MRRQVNRPFQNINLKRTTAYLLLLVIWLALPPVYYLLQGTDVLCRDARFIDSVMSGPVGALSMVIAGLSGIYLSCRAMLIDQVSFYASFLFLLFVLGWIVWRIALFDWLFPELTC